MLIFLWSALFIISLILLVKSADWFIESSEKIARRLKISPFIIGVTIVAFGTSLPELATSLIAVFQNKSEIVVADVIGSNITNILLVVGLSAIFARGLLIKRNIIDLDLPLLLYTSVIFSFVILDKNVNFFEAIILLLTFFVYLFYTIKNKKEKDDQGEDKILTANEKIWQKKEKINLPTVLYFFAGIVGLIIGAKYTIESIIQLSQLLNIATSFLAISVVALGTSLPELFVSVSAALKKKYEIAVGNALGSNIFNSLFVVGVPALFKDLVVDDLTIIIGFPFFAVATLIFIISGISRRINFWEGIMFIIIYGVFIIKLFTIF